MAASPEFSVEFERNNRALAALIARIVSKDGDALAALYDRTNRQIYGLVRHIIGNAATAEEVLFDVYVQVWRQAALYDPVRGSPFAWLFTMARSRALDRLRSGGDGGRQVESLDESHDSAQPTGPEELAIHSEMRRLVRAALDSLPPEQREVIELAYFKGLSQSEISSALGQPLGTVKTRARRGMMKLRDILNPVIEGIL